MENMQLELIRRDYFDPKAAILLKQYKLELWPGYVTSIRQVPPCLLICSFNCKDTRAVASRPSPCSGWGPSHMARPSPQFLK